MSLVTEGTTLVQHLPVGIRSGFDTLNEISHSGFVSLVRDDPTVMQHLPGGIHATGHRLSFDNLN